MKTGQVVQALDSHIPSAHRCLVRFAIAVNGLGT
jgi:hypothetical protein